MWRDLDCLQPQKKMLNCFLLLSALQIVLPITISHYLIIHYLIKVDYGVFIFIRVGI
jgi:hypothetical protein